MSAQQIQTTIEQTLGRVDAVRGKGEEATKQALVLPMVRALGYDIWNPAEVCPEYGADFAIRKFGQKEKVDLAVILNSEPRIFFEVKSLEESLDGHEGQLARYFNSTRTVSLAILTNGIEYRFFTDSEEINVLDKVPFYTARLDSPDPGIEVLARFHKAVFSHEAIRDFATELIYRSKMVRFFREELDLRDRDPSENLVRWVLADRTMYEGRVTSNVVERMSPTVKNALSAVLRDIVRRSLAVLDEQVTTPDTSDENEVEAEIAESADDIAESEPTDDVTASHPNVITTERELDCFAITKAQFDRSSLAGGEIYDPTLNRKVETELAYKDTTGYFVIYFNKPSWWIARIVIESRRPWIGLNVEESVAESLVPAGFERLAPSPWASFRIAINGPEDLDTLNPIIFKAFEKTISDRKESGARAAAG